MIERIMMAELIRHSNLIENIDDPSEDARSLRAWKWFIGQNDLTTGVLLELHRRITLKLLPERERGHWRTMQVYVGNHVPPGPVIAARQISELIDEIRLDLLDAKQLDPKATHIRFETIHPFVDGNGRTGRMLMWWQEIKLGRQPTLIDVDDRWAYYKWFTEARS